MKKCALVLLIGASASLVSALRCWTCHNARSPGECIEFGHSERCKPSEKVCQTEIRYSSGWTKAPSIRTGCKGQHACDNNFLQNPQKAWRPTQCNGDKFNSVCRCCCKTNDCNENSLLCESADGPDLPEPLRRLICSNFPKAPQNGTVICQKSRYPGSQCQFSCKKGYISIGSTTTTCTVQAERAIWKPAAPICRRLYICDIPKPPVDGWVKCAGEGQLGTLCRFWCKDRMQVEGSRTTTCIMTAKGPEWSDDVPVCSIVKCGGIGKLRYGNVTCIGEGNVLGTVCKFQCDKDYLLLPDDRTESECVWYDKRAIWNHRLPCCNSIICPPTAKKDIVIALDSSGSIKGHEWKRMKDFVIHVIRKFSFSEDNVQVAMFRFNRVVDTKSQILFGDFNDVDGLVTAIENLPKDGGGTYIGNALRHIRDNVFTHKNRPNAGDMVWILTDGKSNDDFKSVATELRKNGVEIIALGISRKGQEDFLKQLIELTGDRELVMKVTDVMDSFADDLVKTVTSKICEVSCEE